MATADQASLSALLQLFARVLAYRLKHPVARATTVLVCPGRHQRLLNQPPQRLQYILGTYPPHRAHCLGGFQREAAREYAQAPEKCPLGFGEEIVAPVQSRPHRPLAVRDIPCPARM